jgi:uncharacterized protein involved in outer membrane biogenesis
MADFRDTRITPGGVARWTGIVILAFLIAALITLYFLDWNLLRGPIGRYASAKSGREVRIDGNLKVDLFRWQPHIEVGGLFIGNPSWVGKPVGASVKHAVVEFRLVPAIFGNLILPLVKLEDGSALVVRDANGRSNWDSTTKGPAASWQIPPINRFYVQNGHLEIDDAVRKLKFTGAITSQEQAGTKGSGFQLKGDGTLNGNKFLTDVHGGPLIHVDESKPYTFDATISAGDTHAVVHGNVTHPFHLDQYDADLTVSGNNLSDLYYLTGLAMPRTPHYRITAQVNRNGALYTLHNLAGAVGASDLHGDLTVDVSGAKPMLRGNLSSRVVQFTDLGALVGGGPTPHAAPAGLLPDTVLHTERLRQMDADITYSVDSIRSQDFPLRGLSTHIRLDNGILNLDPLAFGFSAGKLAGSIKLDARQDIAVTSVDARLTDIHIENFIKGSEKPLSGTAEARAVLTGHGNSVHKTAMSASGTATAVIPSGRVRKSLAEWLGIDVLKALSLSLSGDNSDTGVRCAVVHLNAKDGVFTSQQFVFDTDPVLVIGSGSVDMGQETLDLSLQGKPKSFQIFRLRAPIDVKGKIEHPSVGVDTGAVALQGAIGLGLGAINPLAAILAFVDPGLTKDANCSGLISTAKAQGAPVKKTQIPAATAKSKS